MLRAVSVEPPTGADPIAGGSGEFPQVLRFEAALRSTDLQVRTMAMILELVGALVMSDVALFYTVNERLEKYAAEPVVANVHPSRSVDLDEVLRQYRERWSEQDPFAPNRVAGQQVTVLGSQDVSGETEYRRSRQAAEIMAKFSLLPVAEMYLRSGGKVTAAISLMRGPSGPELSPSEVHMLRTLHGLCEHAYRLSDRTAGPGAGVLYASGLTARQREVVLLAVRGARGRDIADTLQISPATVKTHLKYAYRKLGVANRHQALLLLIQAATAGDPPHPAGR